jgi:hypothetical protein
MSDGFGWLVGGLCFVLIGSKECIHYRSTKERVWLVHSTLSFVAGVIMLATATRALFR